MSIEHAEQLLQHRQLAQAADAFDLAESLGADPNRCSGGRWMVAMMRGDFEAAWQESDALRARSSFDPHRFWNGEDLAGQRVIVRCLHGFGDAVQMLRYAPSLKKLAGRVIWEVPPRFVELASCFEGVDQVMTWGEGAPATSPAWDVQVEVMELPYLFRTRRTSLPISERYCRLPKTVTHGAGLRRADDGKRAVGVVWAAGDWNPERSIPFSQLQSLLDIPGIVFCNLQGGAAKREGSCVSRVMESVGDGLIALAATIARLDLVVTVDTLAAHLAGALGKPVWVMLQKEADWRWMAEGELTPWYPTMRLFRQKRSGDWTAVVSQVCSELKKEFA